MKVASRLAILLILLPAAALFSWQQESHLQNAVVSGDPDWSELLGSMDKMHAAMGAVERSGDSDVDFVRLMLPHHQAAIDMARTQLIYGKDPQMRRLAQEIITDQQLEIELMRLWLKQHEPSSLQVQRAPSQGVSKEH